MPKLQMVDTGLSCHLLGLKKPQQLLTSAFYGGLLESFVECFKHLAWAEETMNIYHFRDRKKNEVDIILEQADGNLIGIEVKASSTRESDFKGLRKFAELVGERLKYGLVFYLHWTKISAVSQRRETILCYSVIGVMVVNPFFP